MCKDWDYKADMTEQTSVAAAIIDTLGKRNRDVERMLIAAVFAAGGEIRVHGGHQQVAEQATLQVVRDEANDVTILRVHR